MKQTLSISLDVLFFLVRAFFIGLAFLGLVVLWDIFQGNEIEPDLFLAFSVGLAAEAGIKFRRYIGNESKEPERQVTQTKGQRKIVS
jgi:hypothetical protein